MSQPFCILVLGPPCVGKTTLATKLSETFHLPLLAKDAIKENLFDSLGWKDREWSRKIGRVSFSLLYLLLETLFRAGTSCIAEANFRPSFDSEHFSRLQKLYRVRIMQLVCTAKTDILFQRFERRAKTGRHPGHTDAENLEEFKDVIRSWDMSPLTAGGTVFQVDTTTQESVQYAALCTTVEQFHHKQHHPS